jgi:ATP-binding cassette subfamily C (CFTR/MRP) protein 1
MALAVSLTDTSSTGLLGVSLSSIVSFNGRLAMLMAFWTQMETSLGAIARVKNFEALTESEDKADKTFPPREDWPSQGIIEFWNIGAGYR